MTNLIEFAEIVLTVTILYYFYIAFGIMYVFIILFGIFDVIFATLIQKRINELKQKENTNENKKS